MTLEVPVKFAYADPPYLGCSKKHYGHQHPDANLYDTLEGHRLLIEHLVAEFPDGWALSCTSGNLKKNVPTKRSTAWRRTQINDCPEGVPMDFEITDGTLVYANGSMRPASDEEVLLHDRVAELEAQKQVVLDALGNGANEDLWQPGVSWQDAAARAIQYFDFHMNP